MPKPKELDHSQTGIEATNSFTKQIAQASGAFSIIPSFWLREQPLYQLSTPHNSMKIIKSKISQKIIEDDKL